MSQETPVITNQKDLRAAFWETHPELSSQDHKEHDDYPVKVRLVWCDYIKHMRRISEISEALAQRATL